MTRPLGPRKSDRRALVAAGILGALAIGSVGLAVDASGTFVSSAQRSLPVMPLNVTSTQDWELGDRGALVTDGRTTRIKVQLTRLSAAKQTPALTGNFDGSGGGEPKVITCTAAEKPWTVPLGRSQEIALICDAVVPARIVKDMHYVWAGKR